MTNPQVICDRLLRLTGSKPRVDLPYLLGDQSGVPIDFSSWPMFVGNRVSAISPALLVSVSDVVELSSKEQMHRIAAGRVVAFVENAKPFVDPAKGEDPSDTMSVDSASSYSGLPAESGETVTPPRFACEPGPALIGGSNLHLGPEPVDDNLINYHELSLPALTTRGVR